MKSFIRYLKLLFSANNKTLRLRRKSKIIIGRAFQRLDKSKFLGENVPYAVLAYFSEKGA